MAGMIPRPGEDQKRAGESAILKRKCLMSASQERWRDMSYMPMSFKEC